MLQQQVETDKVWRAASEGFMQMDKITYRSNVGDLDIPAFVFQPLRLRGPKGHPAIVWVHENIRGHLYEHYIPYIREATAKGYVVIAPEYRGSIGYGKAFYDAIDYGGNEVDDVVTAVEILKARYPQVDPSRIGIMGWSHGGMITLLSIFRNPARFKAAVAMVPVTNLFQRLAWKGVEQRRCSTRRTGLAGSLGTTSYLPGALARIPGGQAADSPDRRSSRRAASCVHGALAGLSDRQAADAAARARCEERRGRRDRGEHATHRRAAGEKT
jgi:acetyl esterase/lipase